MPRGARKYPVPEHISKLGISQESFGRWLDRITNAHIVRDRKRRTDVKILAEVYRKAIYRAVCDGGDRDYYTGEPLDWRLLRYFSKSGSSRDGRLVPTVDHEGASTESPAFRICSLRTNKCKSDYSVSELLEFCEAFIRHQRCDTANKAL